MLLTHEYARVVGARIRALRRERNWTLAETIQRVEHPRGGRYSVGLLSRVERGWSNPPLFVYIHIAEALDVDPRELMGPDPGEDGVW